MPKSSSVTKAYNALFQEHTKPGRAITGRQNTNSRVYDKGISCHVFALASPPSWETANDVNEKYSNIGTIREIQRIQARFDHEFKEEDKHKRNNAYVVQPFPELSQVELNEERASNMIEIQEVRNLQETVLPVENMYIVGGFREGKSTPEHMWIEDHTNNMSYDTFINRGGIAVVKGVGAEGEAFKPGCEGSAFKKDEIHRAKTDGYTWGQLIAIAAGAEKYGFPEAISRTPQVLAAKRTVELVNEALDKVPEPELTISEKSVMDKVEKQQATLKTQKEIDAVIENLTVEEKEHYQSALDKIEKVAAERRSVAREIVGRGYNPLSKLTQKCDDIKPERILQAVSMKNAKECRDELLDQLSKIEINKDALPEDERDNFQRMIDEKREQINTRFSEKEQYQIELDKIELAQKCNEIKPELISRAVSMKNATECKDDLLDQLSKIEINKGALPEEEQDNIQRMIDEKREQINTRFSEKEKIGNTVGQIKNAAEKYLQWSNENARGFRLSHLYHGSSGRKQAEKILNLIENDAPISEILKATGNTLESSGTKQHSFSRFLHDEMKADSPKVVGKENLACKTKDFKQQVRAQLTEVETAEKHNTAPRV